MKKALFGILVSLAFAACSSDMETSESQKPTEIKATMSEMPAFDNMSRSILVDNGKNVKFLWQEGDVIGLYAGLECNGLTFYRLKSGEGKPTAIFETLGFSMIVGFTYFAFFPFDEWQSERQCVEVDYNGSIQTENGSSAHLSKKDFQYSLPVSPTRVDKACEFNLKRIGAVARFKFTMPEAGTYTKITLSGTGLIPKLRLNLDTESLSPADTDTNNITLDLGDNGSGITLSAGEVLTAYMMIPRGIYRNITATVTDGNGKEKTFSLGDKVIEAGGAISWTR